MKKRIDINLIENQPKENRIHKYNLRLGEDYFLNNFLGYPKVLSPNLITARFLASWLFYNNGLYLNKTVIDMGCGSGIQGITTGLFGAKKLIFSDISKTAIKNTIKNIKNYKLNKISTILHGDLFEKIKSKADLIIFNHPFFTDKLKGNTISKSLADNNNLIHRFLKDAKKYLKKEGLMIMPYDECAGSVNCPKIQGKKHGYKVSLRFKHKIDSVIKKGDFSHNLIYELRLQKLNFLKNSNLTNSNWTNLF